MERTIRVNRQGKTVSKTGYDTTQNQYRGYI